MDRIDTVRLLAELEGEPCGLNHGPGTKAEDFPASDYIVIPFGDGKDPLVSPEHELVIPVCLECAQALTGEEWTLLYCFECHASRWVCRALAKNAYRHHILWLRGCPDCSHAFGGLYFNDAENPVLDTQLLNHLHRQAA